MSQRSKIIVTRKWPEAVEKILTEKYDVVLNESDTPFDANKMREALTSADALLPTVTDKIDASIFEGITPSVKVIANYGVGYSHIDVDACQSHGIVVTNTPDVLSECTADIAVTLMLMAARRAGEGEREVREGRWTSWRPNHLIGHKVSGKTLGIIGFGRIGQEMAKRAHHGFGMKVLAYNRSTPSDAVLQACGASSVISIDELMGQCDFLSLHCPGGDANRHLINEERLKLMQPHAFLINTARGEVVDEAALAQALQSGTIAGAGLDVYEHEPKVHPDLLECENAVLLPHLGSATKETREGMGFKALNNLDAFFAGQPPHDRVV